MLRMILTSASGMAAGAAVCFAIQLMPNAASAGPDPECNDPSGAGEVPCDGKICLCTAPRPNFPNGNCYSRLPQKSCGSAACVENTRGVIACPSSPQ